jgi:hypothetical protein
MNEYSPPLGESEYDREYIRPVEAAAAVGAGGPAALTPSPTDLDRLLDEPVSQPKPRLARDRSFDRLPRPGSLHLRGDQDPIATSVVFTICGLIILIGCVGTIVIITLLGALVSALH